DPLGAGAERVLQLAAETPEALVAALDAGREGGEGPCRLALVDPTDDRRAFAREIAARGRAWRGRQDLWFTPRGLAADGGRVAFMFPGVEASFEPRVEDVARHFGLPAPAPAGAGLEKAGM